MSYKLQFSLSDEDVQKFATIFLPQDFRRPKIRFSDVPSLPSFLLTSAQMIFEQYVVYCINFRLSQINPALEISNNEIQKQLATGYIASQNFQRIDIFLSALSTAITHILRHYQKSSSPKVVKICQPCVKTFIYDTANLFIQEKNEKTQKNSDQQNKKIATPFIDQFVCDSDSVEAFSNFAKHLNKQFTLPENASFISLLTWQKNQNSNAQVDGVEIVGRGDWRLHYWFWIHQMFFIGSTMHDSMLSISRKLEETSEKKESEILQQRLNLLWQRATSFFDGNVIIPILQLPCVRCSQHAVFDFLPQRIERNVQVILQSHLNKLEKFGYQVHKAVTDTVSLHMHSLDDEAEHFSFSDFKREVKPYLLQFSLKNYHTAHFGPCRYFSKPFQHKSMK